MSVRSWSFNTALSAVTINNKSRLKLSYRSLGAALAGVEAIVMVAASFTGALLYGFLSGKATASIDSSLRVGLLASLLYVLLARSAGLYRLDALVTLTRSFSRILACCAGTVFLLTAFLFLLKAGPDFSRGALSTFAIFQTVFLCGVRGGAASFTRAKLASGGLAGRPVVVIGESAELDRLDATFMLTEFGLTEVDRLAIDGSGSGVSGPAGAVDRALSVARRNKVEEFIIAAEWGDGARVDPILEGLRASPLPVRLLPDSSVRSVLARGATSTNGAPFCIELQRAPLRAGERLAKRSIDICLASLAIFLLAPLFLLTAFAVKIDSRGPSIFRQRRNGFDGRPFLIFKFRTMTVLEDGHDIKQAQKGDQRVTRVGAFLRRTSLDELPQLFNVLKGDMSLVGPRPHALAHDDEFMKKIETYYMRQHVRPGMTGWAQIYGFRGRTESVEQMQRRVDFDLWYINNWSLFLDFRILAQTCIALIKYEAY